MHRPHVVRRTVFLGAAILASLLAVGCAEALPTSLPEPILVTLPMATPDPSTPTPSATPELTAFSTVGTLTASQTAPPTPIPEGTGIGSTRKLWEWTLVPRPSAVAAASNRLGVIVADGRFAWINADTGQLESSAFLWSGILQGDSWGEVYVDGIGTYAVLAVQENSISTSTGLVVSRSRVVAYDGDAKERWSLPELDKPQQYHLYSATMTSSSVVVGKYPYGFADNTLAAYELYSGEKQWEITKGQEGYEQLVHDGDRVYALANGEEQDAVAAFDLRTGEELWRWSDPEMPRPDLISLGPNSLFVMAGNKTVALTSSGGVLWSTALSVDPIAGFGAWDSYIYLVPSATEQTGRNPGIMSLYADGSGRAWHSLSGLFCDALALGDQTLWAIVKNYQSGEVALSGLELETGLERVRLNISYQPDELYSLAAQGRHIYVLGDTLAAFGY